MFYLFKSILILNQYWFLNAKNQYFSPCCFQLMNEQSIEVFQLLKDVNKTACKQCHIMLYLPQKKKTFNVQGL